MHKYQSGSLDRPHRYRSAATKKILYQLFLIICLSVLCFTHASAEADIDNTTIQSNDLFFEYRTEPVKMDSDKIIYNTGRILVKNKIKKIIYDESTNLQPGMCDDYPTISKLILLTPQERMLGGKKEIAVLCGSISGRHMTLKLFLEGPNGLRTTSLDYENTRPNLTKMENKNLYIAMAYRRLLFKEIGYQTVPYLFVYTLYADSSIFGFQPAYGQNFKDQYMSYYQSLMNNIKVEYFDDYIGPLLAALVSSQEKDIICDKLINLNERGLQPKELDDWRRRLVSAGYPDFNFNVCLGR